LACYINLSVLVTICSNVRQRKYILIKERDINNEDF
jgi:hypothetical protein